MLHNVVSMYTSFFKRKPFWGFLILLIYIFFAVWVFFRSEIADTFKYAKEGKQLSIQIKDLEEIVRSKDLIIDTLTRRSKTASFIKNLDFNEKWQSEKTKIEIERLLEYAAFALRKNDSKRAERLYKEAESIQETLSSNYNLGALYYFEGQLESTIRAWEKFITIDSGIKYPIVRFYLSIAYHEKGNNDKSIKILKNYLKESK